MGVVTFHRGRRTQAPAMARGQVEMGLPPELPQPQGGKNFGAVLRMLPMLAGGVAMMLMMTQSGGSRGAIAPVLGVLYGVSMLGMMITQVGRGNDDAAQELDAARRNYFGSLGKTRDAVRENVREQVSTARWLNPDPEALWTLAGQRRMWERRRDAGDYLHVRAGLGPQGFGRRIVVPEIPESEDREPLTVGAMRRFQRTFKTVDGLPVTLPLPSFGHWKLIGQESQCRSLVFALLAQVGMWHAPTDVRIAICVSPDRRAHWEWAKWLPHTQHPDRADGAGELRLMASSQPELSQVLAGVAEAQQAPTHVIVVVDGVAGAESGPDLGGITQVITLDISGDTQVPRRIAAQQAIIEVGRRLVLHARLAKGETGTSELGVPDELSLVAAEMAARAMAPFRMPLLHQIVEDDEAETDVVFEVPKDYPSMVGIPDPITLDTSIAWRLRPIEKRLRVPVGNGEDGQPVELDIKEAALGGMGPHGLCVGATGSGKSEFLRTLVLGLAMTHSSEQLNLVLVDFKGGATFLGLDQLPHVSAVITNLEGELTLVDRMQDAIAGEMERRMEVLRASGNFKNREDYEQARQDGAVMDPMPSLFMVVDEFSELLASRPEFIELFIQIGRIGRSIGVHLLLASQRLEEGKLRGLDTYLSYRIALRTFSPAESRVVIGVPDAYHLPNPPGNGYLKFDTTSMSRFKAAYVSGPWRSTPDSPTRPDEALDSLFPEPAHWVPPVLAFTTGYVRPVEPPADVLAAESADEAEPDWPEPLAVPESVEPGVAEGSAEADDEPEDETLLDIVVDRLRGQGWPAHRVWLPPLEDPPTLDQLFSGPLTVSAERGLGVQAVGQLKTPIALVDKPRQQRRDPLWIDLAGAAGNMAVVGGPQAGKSTGLRTMIASMALTHTPLEVGFYCLDFGGGALNSLRDLPHVGSVCSRLDGDRVRRTVAEMTSLLSVREAAFAEAGIDSMTSYRRGRREGRIAPDRFPTDVFLVIDGWLTLRQEFELLDPMVTSLAGRGLGFGIHVVASTNKWSEFRTGIRDLLQTRIELKLGDSFESELNRKFAALVPAGRPGRGLTPDSLHMMTALPRIDGVEDADDLAAGCRDLVNQVARAWQGEPVAEVRMLPEQLPWDTLPAISYDGRDHRIPIGIDELELDTVFLNPDSDPHFVVFGGPETGKTTLLRSILHGITTRYTPKEAKIVLLDYKRTLLGVVDTPHLLKYCASAAAATPVIKDCAGAIKARLPGSDVTTQQLRDKSWWKGSQLFIVVDDYERVAVSSGNALQPLAEFVVDGNDVGLHIIIARGMGGAGRATFSDQIITRMKESMNPGLIMSGSRDEGQLLADVRPSKLPSGRGTLVTKEDKYLIQTAVMAPVELD